MIANRFFSLKKGCALALAVCLLCLCGCRPAPASEPETEQPSLALDSELVPARGASELVAASEAAAEKQEACEAVLRSLTVQEKAAQLIMPAFRMFNGTDVTELNSETADLLSRLPYGGVILFSENTHTAQQTAALTHAMQQANCLRERCQLLIGIDQEGGTVTRLQTGTQTPGNMALGAVGDPEAAAEMGALIGEELRAVGIHVDFAPVLDVNIAPANPVIGVRAFSDDPALTAALGAGFLRGLKDGGVIGTCKHFPGHGDTHTDSHTGLPSIDKSAEALEQTELKPFAAAIKAGAEMIMTAHIQFPALTTETRRSAATNEEIVLPATLSEEVVSGLLRKTLGFDGVVVTDAMNMEAVASHFSQMDAACLAINAGVDLLLAPVNTATPAGLAALEQYTEDLAACVSEGRIPEKTLDAAVLRVLSLKYDHGLLCPYPAEAAASRGQEAAQTVGSEAHHAREWEVAKRAVTLVKNDGDLLPAANVKRVVLLAAAKNEILSMEYAVQRLREEGKLAPDVTVKIDTYAGKTAKETELLLQDAELVLAVSELYSARGLDPASSAGAAGALLDRLIAATHENGGRFAVISAHLPYDAARFPAADAILLAYSDKGMSEDPRAGNEGVAQYGPNIPAAVYLALDPGAVFTGKLPVSIPRLTEAYGYADEVLYPRGFGLE